MMMMTQQRVLIMNLLRMLLIVGFCAYVWFNVQSGPDAIAVLQHTATTFGEIDQRNCLRGGCFMDYHFSVGAQEFHKEFYLSPFDNVPRRGAVVEVYYDATNPATAMLKPPAPVLWQHAGSALFVAGLAALGMRRAGRRRA